MSRTMSRTMMGANPHWQIMIMIAPPAFMIASFALDLEVSLPPAGQSVRGHDPLQFDNDLVRFFSLGTLFF